MSKLDVSVILVGLNTRQFVKNCIESLLASDWGQYSYEIVYVDNGSKDDSVAMVRRHFPDVVVIANETNRHFCPAGNQAARAAKGRYLFHLNNDTVVEPDAVPMLVRFLDTHPEAAAVGCRLLNPDGSDQWSARRFPEWYNGLLGRRSLLSKWFPESGIVKSYLYKDEMSSGQPFRVDWTPTVAMLIREEDYWAVGGVPEDLYYWHEAVFCFRLSQRGRETWVAPAARIWHYEGHGGGVRTYAVRQWHIRNFSHGAYRLHCERYGLKAWDPSSILTALSLRARATVQLALLWLSARGGKTA
ncbi:MAG: glycosyltransferase family 2 protein [Bryobacter sp.]|nr:glycosyltransferase family 2 protein [Bryobacter sp.]